MSNARAGVVFSLVLAVAIAAPAALQAQARGHSGFHASVGVGSGSARATCEDCSDERTDGGALMLRFGGAIRPGVVLSGELNGWAREEDNVRSNASLISFVAQFYPEPTGGFFTKVGAGLGGIEVTVTVPGFGTGQLRTASVGVTAGVGYDIHLSRGFSLTPYLDAFFLGDSEARINGGDSGSKLGGNVVYLGLAASWR